MGRDGWWRGGLGSRNVKSAAARLLLAPPAAAAATLLDHDRGRRRAAGAARRLPRPCRPRRSPAASARLPAATTGVLPRSRRARASSSSMSTTLSGWRSPASATRSSRRDDLGDGPSALMAARARTARPRRRAPADEDARTDGPAAGDGRRPGAPGRGHAQRRRRATDAPAAAPPTRAAAARQKDFTSPPRHHITPVTSSQATAPQKNKKKRRRKSPAPAHRPSI